MAAQQEQEVFEYKVHLRHSAEYDILKAKLIGDTQAQQLVNSGKVSSIMF